MGAQEHQDQVRTNLKIGIVTASDTRTAETDKSGAAIREMFTAAGHSIVYYEIVPDAPSKIAHVIITHLPEVDAIVVNGGTGLARRDVSTDVVRSLLDKEIEGFGELFRMLSYQDIGAAAMLSRAVAGIRHGKFIAALPGSTGACRLAMEKLILPEIGHITYLLSQ
ncbi:MAG TPA: molybdenum cofactor biosynthesis protein B [Candidatus Binataceae bacterium]|nr:molybdenum cofactor biosynthesis protein B [Candidatus Binataceae bacterium]